MDTAIIEEAAKQIRELSDGIEWLQNHGQSALCHRDKDSFSVVVHLNSCGAIFGAKPAAKMLGAQARLLGHHLMTCAITDANNTIEILKQRISREIEKG